MSARRPQRGRDDRSRGMRSSRRRPGSAEPDGGISQDRASTRPSSRGRAGRGMGRSRRLSAGDAAGCANRRRAGTCLGITRRPPFRAGKVSIPGPTRSRLRVSAIGTARHVREVRSAPSLQEEDSSRSLRANWSCRSAGRLLLRRGVSRSCEDGPPSGGPSCTAVSCSAGWVRTRRRFRAVRSRWCRVGSWGPASRCRPGSLP